MHYKEYGDKSSALMVFIHGGGVSGWMWDKQVEYFSSKFHCLVPDMPEQGNSKSGTPFTINGAAEEIITLIEEAGKGKPVIAVGFSLGAQVLITILSKKPKLIDFAMINSALVKPIPFANMLIKSMRFAFPFVKLKAFSNIQAKSMYINEDYFNIYYQESRQISKDTFSRIMNENMSFKTPQTFKDARSKIVVTVGEKEKKIMKDSMREILKSNPNCKSIILPEIGHGFPLANPLLFNNLLEEWIENDVLITET